MHKPTVNTTEAAEMMKVHPKTVEDLIHKGDLAAGKIGKAWVIKTSDVLALIDKKIMAQTAERLRKIERRKRSPELVGQV
ncbi:helix-turn-helix domain-containing protein [Aquabacterium sp.]|uniref:helix-turn-helix domain-containing protein n=1 Tax=Aquabacterium sp. TaxID=1872578 RepID=UPI0035B40A30